MDYTTSYSYSTSPFDRAAIRAHGIGLRDVSAEAGLWNRDSFRGPLEEWHRLYLLLKSEQATRRGSERRSVTAALQRTPNLYREAGSAIGYLAGGFRRCQRQQARVRG